MARPLWPLAVIAAFVVGWAMAGVTGKMSPRRDAEGDAEQLAPRSPRCRRGCTRERTSPLPESP